MNRKTFLVLFLLSTLTFPALAQEKDKGILSKVKMMQKLFDSSDPLKKTLSKIEQLKTEEEKQRQGPVMKNPDALLKTLRNPFIPDLPSPESPPTEKPKIVPIAPTAKSEPSKKTEISKPHCKISGLVWNTRRPQAIVNGQIVNIGDTVDSWTIVNIGKNGIEVSAQDKTFLIEP